MNIIISALILVLGGFGGFFMSQKDAVTPLKYDGLNPSQSIILGATNFPTSLDALTNPSGTDSVATVSHSGQHSNANDAIEALEAKLGINASTPITDSIFVGTSAGGSQWSTFATSTRFAATNFLATGSSTLQNFTFVNATGTSATTTNFFSTTASSTNLFSTTASTTNFFGADLATCSGANFLQWTGGKFVCAADTSTGISSVSTTSAQDLATTTIRNIPFGKITKVSFMLATTSDQSIRICFNEDWGGCGTTTGYYHSTNVLDGGTGAILGDATFATINANGAGTGSRRMFGEITIFNSSTTIKSMVGQLSSIQELPLLSYGSQTEFALTWASTTAAINSISIITGTPALLLGAGSYIQVDVIEN